MYHKIYCCVCSQVGWSSRFSHKVRIHRVFYPLYQICTVAYLESVLQHLKFPASTRFLSELSKVHYFLWLGHLNVLLWFDSSVRRGPLHLDKGHHFYYSLLHEFFQGLHQILSGNPLWRRGRRWCSHFQFPQHL